MMPNNPLVGGGTLRYPQIQSPNFSLADQTGWAIFANGDAFFFDIVASGDVTASSVIIDGTNGNLLIYSGPPASGNLIGSIAGAAGTDQFGNTIPAGENIGVIGQGNLELTPNADTPFDITAVLSGVFSAVISLFTSDPNETFPGLLGSLVLGSGGTAKMAAALVSPFVSEGAALVLQAQNDGGTDTPVITFGTVSSPDATTEVFSPVMTITPFTILLYNGAGGQTTTLLTGSGNWPVPSTVSAVKAEVWGAGNNGAAGTGGTLETSGGGAGAGEYAAEPALAVTPSGTVAYSQGVTAGASSTFGTVTGHGGAAGNSNGTPGAGGTGSANTVHKDGGAGGQGNSQSGTSSSPFSLTTTAAVTYSYQGPDGNQPNQKINSGGNLMQGNDGLGDNGTTSGFIVWSAGLPGAIAGVTITQITLTLKNEHSFNNSGMTYAFGYTTSTPGGASRPSITNPDLVEGNTAELDTHTYGFSGTGHLTDFINAIRNGWPFVLFKNGASVQFYGYAAGSGQSGPPKLVITGTTGGTTETGGGGAGGNSGGSTGPGNAGGAGAATGAGGSPGAAQADSGQGGKGGGTNANGSAGSAPGGGGGGGGVGSGDTGGAFAPGQIRVTYTTGAPPIMMSISTVAGTDQFGTAYEAGCHFTGADGNVYRFEKATEWQTGTGQIVSSTATVNITGLSAPVVAGSYKIRALVPFQANQSAGTATITVTAPAASFVGVGFRFNLNGAAANNNWHTTIATIGGGIAMTSGAYWVEFEGIITFTASGTLQFKAQTSAGADTFTIQPGAMLDIEPIG
jgi:hypothetical protein